ncbi:hypothetical protein BGZ73_001001 [Actinomortierella ambigua]|nr:hypothetical protein BGZ73_001001 [Actinomortierella ambigua]
MSDTPLCGFQGIALVYLVAVLFIQGITLVANLHCLAVYDSLRVQRHISTCIAMSFVLPVVLIIPPALRGQFGFSGYGSICFMSAKWVNTYFFYPVGAMMIVSVMVHLSTVIFMIKMYFTRKQQRLASSDTVATLGDSESHHERGGTARDITRMLKQQWRPGAFAMCQIKKFGHINSSVEWFQQWIACFYQQAIDNIQQLAISTPSATVADLTSDATVSSLGDAAQQTCLAITSPHVPVFWKLVFSDMAPAVFGLCIFLIFGSKAELWQDWHEYLFERSAKMPWDEQKPHRVIGTVTSASNNPPDAQEKRHSSQDGGTTKGHGLGREPKHSRSIPLASPGEKKADDASQLYKHRNSTEDELEDMTVLDAYTHGRNLS